MGSTAKHGRTIGCFILSMYLLERKLTIVIIIYVECLYGKKGIDIYSGVQEKN